LQPTGEWLNQPGGLAERLQKLRKAAGLTGDRLAELNGWPRSKVPKIENGRQMPTEADIKAWTKACGRSDAAVELLDLLGDAQSVHRQWRHQLRGGHAALQAEFDALVRGAKRIRNFEIAFIPGLLQTEDYTRYRALETVRLHGAAAEGVDAAIAARRARQDVLYEEGKTFEFVITEAAFRLLPCPRPVMLAQLDRLMTASTLANVTLGIIPFDVELNVMPMVGFLSVDNLTVAETFTSEDAVGPTESKKYREIFALLMAEAATGDEARRRIAAAATGLREESGGAVEQH
jgi:transcriptional regulator with XRE-family HTH domain